jgi:hypothetical protein
MIFLVFVGIVSLIVETARFSLIPAYNAAEIDAVSWYGFFGEFMDVALSVGIFLYILVLGGAKFSKCFSYLFEFKVKTYSVCRGCGNKTDVKELPIEPES